MKARLLLIPILTLLCGAFASAAHAVTLSGRAATQALWFSDESGRDHVDLAGYLRFSARGEGAGNTLSLTGYGRAWGDAQQGGGVEGRLYYFFLDRKDLPARTDVRLGRQYFFVSAGSGIVDGARIDTRPIGPLKFTAVGGRHVLFDLAGEETRKGDVAAAVQVSLAGIPDASADLSYYVSYDENDLARETVGLQASKRLGRYGEAYAQARLDLLSEVWSEILAGARTAVVPDTTITVEYFRTIPQFDATSIFSVFAVERFQEILCRVQYDLSSAVSLNGEFRNESYGGGDTANAGELGLRYRPRDGSRYSVYAAGIWRNGTGGSLVGFDLSGDVTFDKKHVLAAGVQHDSFRRELMTGYDQATKFWVGGEARFRRNVSASARLEDIVATDRSKDLRARVALNVDF